MSPIRQQIFLRISESVLLLILIILPFSCKNMDNQWIVFLSILLSGCIFLFISKKIMPVNYRILRVIFALLFMFIFDIAENVNIIRTIPLSTIFIAVALFTYMIHIIIQRKVKLICHPFMLYFFYACVFLIILTIIFYPFFYYHYQMQMSSNIHLFSKIVKYSILFILITNYLANKEKFKKMNLGFILSLAVTIVLSVLIKMINS